MLEILKPLPLNAHGYFVFGVCKFCKKQTKGHEVELTAIIQLDVAQYFTQNMYGKRNLGTLPCRTIALKRTNCRS